MVERSAIIQQVSSYYGSKLATHGATSRGVDWNSEESQTLRFSQFDHLLPTGSTFSIIDFGCGYGALADYLNRTGRHFDYVGYDVNEAMIATAIELHSDAANCSFTNSEALLKPADFCVASGLFNVKLQVPRAEWEDYIHDTLHTIAANSTRGFAFNVLTQYSDRHRMRDDLFYADPSHVLAYCITHFSRHVAVLHDYGLYEFTVLVRKVIR